MKLISWNVNGIRAVHQRGFTEFIHRVDADVVCLQEIKATQEQANALDLGNHFQRFWNPALRKGYSGTAILTKETPLTIQYGMEPCLDDTEGRILTAEYPDFYLVNVYTPNSKRDLSRLDYRFKSWDPLFLQFLKHLEKRKPVICCGDLNVAHQEIDLARPKENQRNAGFTKEEREGIDTYIRAGFIDTFREFENDTGHYTWWSYMNQSRSRNIGWRIDYFLISASLRPRLKKAFILSDILGSDHCPVGIILE